MDKLKIAATSAPCASERLHLGADSLYSVIEVMDDAIFVLDPEMRCWYCNSRIKQWLGVPESELPRGGEKAPISTLFGIEASEQEFRRQFRRTLADGSGYLECLIQPAGDSTKSRWLEIKLNRVAVE